MLALWAGKQICGDDVAARAWPTVFGACHGYILTEGDDIRHLESSRVGEAGLFRAF